MCEFMGEVLTQEEAEKRGRAIGNGDEYMFDLDCIQQVLLLTLLRSLQLAVSAHR